ncbi:MAG TPA: polysaccharide deacetylase family protein [Ferruginibacter sp.]|nr:polysaccharide deacetylase family protein [Ferruginibacter sp.]
MLYTARTPKWVIKLFNRSVWDMPDDEKVIYLSFDDGPHPQITPFVLDELNKYNAKATFFCIGKNVEAFPEVFQKILHEGHAVGNHTFDHLNGWKTGREAYIGNILKAREYIKSSLFRPPYGKITPWQHKVLLQMNEPFKIIMWSVLSGDFDTTITPKQCCKNVIENAKSGSVIVFHDSEKAYERMKYSLPIVLKTFSEKGFLFEKIHF